MKPANLCPFVTGRKEFGFPAGITHVRVLYHIPIGLKDTGILTGLPKELPREGRQDGSIPDDVVFRRFSLNGEKP